MKFSRLSDLPRLPASHEDPLSPGSLKQVLFAAHELCAGRVMMVNWATLPPGRAFRRHYHEDMHEVFVMISGAAELEVNSSCRVVSSGDAFIIEPGERHLMRNRGAQEVQYLVFGVSSGEQGKTVVVEELC